MAIDTAEKRRSVAGLPHLPMGWCVTSNAAKDAEWRQQAGWGYSGIAASAPAPPPAYTPQGRFVANVGQMMVR